MYQNLYLDLYIKNNIVDDRSGRSSSPLCGIGDVHWGIDIEIMGNNGRIEEENTTEG